jgi:RNA polymerase sigma-70 factor (ECF subfamily)
MAMITTLSPPMESDELLLARFRGGERDAVDELFRRHRGTAYRLAFRLLGQEPDALQAVQNGFIKALALMHEALVGQFSFKAWLLRVVSDAALELGRKRATSSLDIPAADEHSNGQQQALSDHAAVASERADLHRVVEAALAALPEAQRRIFVLHTEGKLTYREVAEVMGISIDNVMNRLSRARQEVMARLASNLV